MLLPEDIMHVEIHFLRFKVQFLIKVVNTQFQVSIVGATNPKTLTTQDLLFETFLHLPEKQIFEIKTASAQEFPISIKSHNDKISNFIYDETLDKISYEIPFNWNEHNHDSNISQIISFEKDFSSIKPRI